jgi:HK97 family phage major capsid protein
MKSTVKLVLFFGLALAAAAAAMGAPDATGGALLLATAAPAVDPKNFTELTAAMKSAFEKFNGMAVDLKDRVRDLEQRADRRPGESDAKLAGQLMAAIRADENFEPLLNGKLKSARFSVDGTAFRPQNAISSTISQGTISQPDRAGVITAPGQQRLSIRDLLPVVETNAGSTEFVRELVYTNNAGPQYDASSPNPHSEGAAKNESDMTFELVNSPVVTIAHAFTVSRQALDDSAALQSHLELRGIFGLKLEEEQELLTGDGLAGSLDGLVGNAAAFTGGATNQTRLDTLRKAITQVVVANHFPTGIVLNPVDAEALELAKDSESRYMGVVIYVGGQPYVWRLAIIESNSMTLGQFLVGDFAAAATIRDRQQATVEISLDHKDYRTRNLALILIEERIGLEIHRPNAMVTGSLSYTG